MDNNEIIIFSNSFGVITNKRIVVHYRHGATDIPLDEVSDVSFERRQSILLTMVYFAAGILVLVNIYSKPTASNAFVIFSWMLFIYLVLIGVAYFIGHHKIVLNVAGRHCKPVKVEMARTKEGKAFVDAIQRQIGA